MDRRAYGALIFAPALVACRSPTQISVTVETDVDCGVVTATSFTSGELGKIEDAPPTTVSMTCTGTHLGTVVLVPSTDDNAEVGFKIVTALNGESLDTCKGDAGANDANCIVSRRGLRYLAHTPLEVRVNQTIDCEGKICDPYSTCVSKSCRSATISDPSACEGAGCNGTVLGTADAGGENGGDDAGIDATISDSGDDATSSDATIDSTISDAAGDGALEDAPSDAPVDSTIPPDAADGAIEDSSVADSSNPFDSGPFDAMVIGCDLGGLQQGAAYPMESYCPSARNRSPLVGPPSPPLQKWFVDLNGFAYASPSVGADGTVYVPSVGISSDSDSGYTGGAVQAIHPDGGTYWSYAPDAGSSFDQLPVIAADSTLRFWDLASRDYTILALDGGLRSLVHEPTNARGGLTIVSGGTMYVPDDESDLIAYAPDGGILWTVIQVSTDYAFATVNGSGSIFTENTENQTTGFRSDGGIEWQMTSDAGASINQNPSPVVVATDGTLLLYDGNGDLWSLDGISGHENWHHNFASPGDISGLAVADDGKTYLATRNALLRISTAGTVLANPPGDFGAPVIDANGDVYVYCNGTHVCSFDSTLTTSRFEYTIPNPLSYDFAAKPVIGPGGTLYVITTTIGSAGRLHAIGPGP